MPRNYAAEPYNKTKRKDRRVTDEFWLKEFLREGHWGVLATVHGGQPCINTNLFVYDERAHAIYTHTARYGRTRANLDADERVCFTVSSMGRILPAQTALDFSVEYAQVTVFGSGTVVTDADRACTALKTLMQKYAPHLEYGVDYGGISAADLKRTSVYCISIDSWSGKQNAVAEDYPGSYSFPIQHAEQLL